MRNKFYSAAIGVALACGIATAAQATPFSQSFGPTGIYQPDNMITFDLWVPDSIIGDAMLELTMAGDFDRANENAWVWLDGNLIGDILNNDTGDDPFGYANGDDPDWGDHGPNTGTATLAYSFIEPLIADGELEIKIITSSHVDFADASGTLSYYVPDPQEPPHNNPPPSNHTSGVSEPGTLAIFGLGLAGLGFWRRRSLRTA